ncbi:MAG TPA: response regulator [Acidimicrobiales bacterium]|nr:response regulator [Acidimicrobiales bacterium]
MAILVVDDSRAMRMIVRRELRKAGYEDVVEAENGAVALTTISDGGVDLVLSDWNMPDMNGIDLLTNLRASGNVLPFGFVTSESAPDVRARAFETGASFIITKPFTSDDLDREISLALGCAPGGPEGQEIKPRTVGSVLEGLLGREVVVRDSPAPDRAKPRGIAEYTSSSGQTIYAVMEMPLTAALACALARIPTREAEEWAQAHSFNDTIESNFFEVANVLGAFASTSGERCVLKTVSCLSEGEIRASMREDNNWHSTATISVEGYPTGRIGFVAG